MRYPLIISATLAAVLLAAPLSGAMQQGGRVPDPKVKDIWQPAKTPPGGTGWSLLEQTKLIDRTDPKTKTIYTKPDFPAAVKALNGKQIKVAGWMMPLENAKAQKHWVMLGYPPGCPFHMHALPNQFIEIKADMPVPVNETKVHVMTGTLQLIGQDESGIFYRLVNARPA
jgi:uncharacterized protein